MEVLLTYSRILLNQHKVDGREVFKKEAIGQEKKESCLVSSKKDAEALINSWNRQGGKTWKYTLSSIVPHKVKEGDFIHSLHGAYRVGD